MLSKYNLDIEKVVKSTKKSHKANGNKAYKKWDADATIKYLKSNPDDVGKFLAFNLPYCDLDDFGKYGNPKQVRQIGNGQCGAHLSISSLSLPSPLLPLAYELAILTCFQCQIPWRASVWCHVP